MKKVPLFGGAVIAAAVAAIVVDRFVTTPIDALVDAAEDLDHRVTEARISGGFPYRPPAPVTRGTRKTPAVMAVAVTAGGGSGRVPRDPHALAVSQLLLGDWHGAADAFDAALRAETGREQRSAGLAASNDAELLTDLAAAHHAVGRNHNQPRAFVVALEAAERAWRMRRTPEIAWNRALARESLHLRAAAREAWEDYLAIDPDSPWADEVRERLHKLAAPTAKELWDREKERLPEAARRGDFKDVDRIVRAYPLQTRMDAEHTYLLAWASGGAAAEQNLAVARAVADALRRFSGESMLHDTVAQIDAAPPALRSAIRRALVVYASAVTARKEWRVSDASPLYAQAQRELDAAGSPFAQMARMYRMHCDRYTNHLRVFEESEAWIRSAAFDERRYRAVSAQVRWGRGICLLSAGRPQAAIAEYSRALESFIALGENDNITSLHLLLCEAYEFVGDDEAAWRHRIATLRQLAASGATYTHLLEAPRVFGISALKEGMPAAALVIFAGGLTDSTDPANFDSRVYALLWRSAAHRALGDHDAALADLRTARDVAGKIRDKSAREHALMAPEMVRDRLAQTRDGVQRQRILDEAIAVARQRDFGFRVAQLYLDQGLEHIRAGRLDAARAILFDAAEELEKQRGAVGDEERRGTFLYARQPIYAALIDLLCRRGEYGRAFDVVERSRARSLLDVVSGQPYLTSRPFSLPEVRATLADDTMLVEFGRVGDQFAVWLVSASEVRFVSAKTGMGDVERLADRFRIAVRDGDDDVRAAAAALYDAIIRPWQRHAMRYPRLVLVPNQTLTGVPFAALLDASTDKFLIDQHVLENAPSASVYAACVLRDRQLQGPNGPVLIMAPSTSASSGGEILLAASESEATAIAETYREAEMFAGERATRAEFLARAAGAGMIHFGGHTGSSASPVPHLVFAGSAAVHAEDLRAIKLRARLVVLAACSSGRESVTAHNQGTASLARAFLAAGAPAVVAPLWDVDDEATAKLSRRLHRFIAAGHDPASALRLAQLQAMSSRRGRTSDIDSWAAFALVGGISREGRRH